MRAEADLKNRLGAQMCQSRSGLSSTHQMSRHRGVNVKQQRFSSISTDFEHPNRTGSKNVHANVQGPDRSRGAITIEAQTTVSRRFWVRTGLYPKSGKVGSP